jgi:hypothetical protein
MYPGVAGSNHEMGDGEMGRGGEGERGRGIYSINKKTINS